MLIKDIIIKYGKVVNYSTEIKSIKYFNIFIQTLQLRSTTFISKLINYEINEQKCDSYKNFAIRYIDFAIFRIRHFLHQIYVQQLEKFINLINIVNNI